jgi:uncharacterized protein YneR
MEDSKKKAVKRIMVTVIEKDWEYFKAHHICISTFLQDKMTEMIPLAMKNNGVLP